jgi:hypothetical protein
MESNIKESTIKNIKESNNYIIQLITQGNVFSIIRLGLGGETYKTFDYITTGNMDLKYLHPQDYSLYNAGIYTKNNDLSKIKLFLSAYNNAIKNTDCLASFKDSNIENIQNYFSNIYNLPKIHSRSLEPFYSIMENQKPWTHYLHGKKVLIINPFVESFKKQMNNNFKIFKDEEKKIFLDGQDFIYYKCYQTIAGNYIHNDWFETFQLMCKDIKELDFDIALLGCGGYGLPLCNYIKSKLNKSSIYIGGGLQLLFGVMGNRWENNDFWKEIIKDNDCKFIKPSIEELCVNANTIENGCYW